MPKLEEKEKIQAVLDALAMAANDTEREASQNTGERELVIEHKVDEDGFESWDVVMLDHEYEETPERYHIATFEYEAFANTFVKADRAWGPMTAIFREEIQAIRSHGSMATTSGVGFFPSQPVLDLAHAVLGDASD